jgi:hypothetical protein
MHQPSPLFKIFTVSDPDQNMESGSSYPFGFLGTLSKPASNKHEYTLHQDCMCGHKEVDAKFTYQMRGSALTFLVLID